MVAQHEGEVQAQFLGQAEPGAVGIPVGVAVVRLRVAGGAGAAVALGIGQYAGRAQAEGGDRGGEPAAVLARALQFPAVDGHEAGLVGILVQGQQVSVGQTRDAGGLLPEVVEAAVYPHADAEFPDDGVGLGEELGDHERGLVGVALLPGDVVAVQTIVDGLVEQGVGAHRLGLRGHDVESALLAHGPAGGVEVGPGHIAVEVRVDLRSDGGRHALAYDGERVGLIGGRCGLDAGRLQVVHAQKLLAAVLLGRIVDDQSLVAAAGQVDVLVAHAGRRGAVGGVGGVVERVEPDGHAVGVGAGVLAPVDVERHGVELVAVDIQFAALATREGQYHDKEDKDDERPEEERPEAALDVGTLHPAKPEVVHNRVIHLYPPFYRALPTGNAEPHARPFGHCSRLFHPAVHGVAVPSAAATIPCEPPCAHSST